MPWVGCEMATYIVTYILDHRSRTLCKTVGEDSDGTVEQMEQMEQNLEYRIVLELARPVQRKSHSGV